MILERCKIRNVIQLLLVACFFVPSSSYANIFLNKEILKYDIQVMGVDMGEAEVSIVGKRQWRGKPAYALLGNVKSNTKWSNIYPVDNMVASIYNATKRMPVYTEMEFDFNRKIRNYNIWFNSGTGNLVKVRKNTKKIRRKFFNKKIPRNAQDLLSWIYYLRALKLNVGESFSFTIFSGNHSYTVKCKVEKIESLETRLGNHRAYVVNMKITRNGNKRYRKEAVLWIDSHDTRLPLKAKVTMPFGLTEITLSSVSKKQL